MRGHLLAARDGMNTRRPLLRRMSAVEGGSPDCCIWAKTKARSGACSVGSGQAQGRLCDSAVQAGTRTKAVMPSPGRAHLDWAEAVATRTACGRRSPAALCANRQARAYAVRRRRRRRRRVAHTSQTRQRPAPGHRPLPLSRFPQLKAGTAPSRPEWERDQRPIQLALDRGNRARAPCVPRGAGRRWLREMPVPR
jgi:hypothetical protein